MVYAVVSISLALATYTVFERGEGGTKVVLKTFLLFLALHHAPIHKIKVQHKLSISHIMLYMFIIGRGGGGGGGGGDMMTKECVSE